MKEVGDEFIFAVLELFFGNAVGARDSDVEAVLGGAHQVAVEKVDDTSGVVPGPRAKNTDLVHGLRRREVVEERVEVVERHGAHLAPKSTHFQLGLVVHLTNQLLTKLQLHLELSLLLAEEIGTLL